MTIKFVSYLRKSSDMLYIKELTGEFVDSVKTIANFRFVKVGQTKAYLGNQRHLHLNATNKCNLEDLSDMLSLAHPFDIRYKLTDHIVRKQILEDHEAVKAIDKLFAKNAFGMSDGFTEILMFPAEWSTDKIVKTITSSYNKLMNSDVTKFIKNTEREDEYNKNKNEYIVPTSIAQLMWNDVDVSNKTVLIIRQFPDWFIDRICREAKHVVYFIDNNNASMDIPSYDNLELVLCDSIDTKYKNELEEYFDNMNDKFDLVIANPPYSIGNKIITESMKHCDEAVVLMPVRDYKSNGLYKMIESIETIDPNMFKGSGAYVQHGLSICSLSHDANKFDTWEEAELNSFDPNFRLVYEWNRNHALVRTFTEKAQTQNTTYENNPFNLETDFLASCKILSPYNGVYFGGFDYAANVTLDIDTLRRWCANICSIRFSSKQEKNNFTTWWYSNKTNSGLTSKLLFGLNKTTTPLIAAIPVIDWSKTDVEYTDEYVLSQMGLKWNEDKTGVELV